MSHMFETLALDIPNHYIGQSIDEKLERVSRHCLSLTFSLLRWQIAHFFIALRAFSESFRDAEDWAAQAFTPGCTLNLSFQHPFQHNSYGLINTLRTRQRDNKQAQHCQVLMLACLGQMH